MQAQEILVAAAAQAESADTDRAVVMLAEAVWAAICAADAAAMLLAAQRVADVVPPQRDGRTAFFALFAQGSAQVVAGEGERGAEQIRQAVEILERSDELRDDPRLLAWAAMGSPWLRQAHLGPALGDRALAAARSQSAVGVLPSVLLQVSIGHAASDRWTEAWQASTKQSHSPVRPARTPSWPGRWPAWRCSRPGWAARSKAACTLTPGSTCLAGWASA
jgi:hypothetical protein